MASKKSRWKRILPFAMKYGVKARGYSPTEILEQIVTKARNDGIDLTDEEYEEMLDICGLVRGYKTRDRFCDSLFGD